eukprot:TRINITY_DN13625_c0_g1_i1.p1 TRINITY_DN13625_c0_g1~~TRINITY_DN13625_c0_g1_i1.p1  ORF type:complete len:375 (+),score=133.87 TRINITY_DN13625_c0_g1_i1:40-1125(+)
MVAHTGGDAEAQSAAQQLKSTAAQRQRQPEVVASAGEQAGYSKDGRPPPPYEKSLVLAYFFWLIGWWCGLHHWYLERHGQAFLWMTSFGGFFIGSGLDFFYIPGYVSEANGNWAYYPKGQRFGLGAYTLYGIYANYYGAVLSGFGFAGTVAGAFLALPAITFGRRKLGVPSMWTLGMAAIFSLLSINNDDGRKPSSPEGLMYFARGLLGACQVSMPDKEHTTGKPVRSRLGLFLMVILGMVVTSHYIEITTVEGETSTLAKQFTRLGEMLYNAVTNIHSMGWEDFVHTVRNMDDEEKGLKVLELEKGATLKDVKSACKRLKLYWHPDKPTGDKEKMQEINDVCTKLKNLYKVRGAHVQDDD